MSTKQARTEELDERITLAEVDSFRSDIQSSQIFNPAAPMALADTEETLSKEGIVDRLRPLKPHKVILLGSHAWGTPRPDSDIDLLVVLPQKHLEAPPEDTSRRGALYRRVARRLRDIERTVPLDLIVHTRSMHQAFLERDSMFARKVKREGEVLYERSD